MLELCGVIQFLFLSQVFLDQIKIPFIYIHFKPRALELRRKNKTTQFGYKVSCQLSYYIPFIQTSTVSAPFASATKCIFIIRIHFSMHYFSYTFLKLNHDEQIENIENGIFSRVYFTFFRFKWPTYILQIISHTFFGDTIFSEIAKK